MKRHVKKGDKVQIIAGKHKGLKGDVVEVLTSSNRVRVSGVMSVHHEKSDPASGKQGGRVERLGSIHISNVLPVDPESGKGTRVGIRVEADGRRVRYAKRSGKLIA